MSISTYSKFYYGITITESNSKLDFDEGGAELTATLDTGTYTPEEIADEVETQLNAAGAFTYTVTFDRTTRILTITSSASMTMRRLTGTNLVQTAFTTLGYSVAANATGTSFVAGTALGSVYSPQFILQSYIPVENMIEQLHSTVNETVTGRQEIITYGDMYMMKCNIMYITNISQPSNGPIINSATGVADAIAFFSWICKKNKVEFIPNVAVPATYINLVLDASAHSKDGTKMSLKELYDKGLPGYFETESLTFRKVV